LGIAREYRKHGFHVALDDYGAGYSGLNLLADLSPDEVKLDMDLIRHLDRRPVARAIVRSTAELCARLGLGLVAEGVETLEEYEAVLDCGVSLMQGYLLAKPGFETLPAFTIPGRSYNSETLSGQFEQSAAPVEDKPPLAKSEGLVQIAPV
jgi:EAL domain-containing protein (putative c-di-GMP-specific phosphodiesterase class I)